MYWQICEDKCFESEHGQHYRDLIEPLAKLYSYIIENQARLIHHLTSHQAARAWKDVTRFNVWNEMIDNINGLDCKCRSYVELGHQSEIRANGDSQLQATQDILARIEEHRQDDRKQNYPER